MAPHSSPLAWKIPWTEEPGGLQSMGSLRVGHDWATSLSLLTFLHWRRKWQPTPVFLPGESQGRRSLVGCRLWGHRVGHDWSDSAAGAAEANGVRWTERGVADSHCFYQACTFEIVSSTPIAPIQSFLFYSILNSKWDFAACLRKLKQGLCINLEEWDGERDGREFPKGGDICILWLIHVKVWQKTAKIL